MTTLIETWKPVKGFPNYEISNQGRCRSIDRVTIRNRFMHGKHVAERIPFKGQVLKKRYDRKGYVRYRIYDSSRASKTFRAHRLVVEAFIGEIPEGLQVNHKNGVKDDNRVENLEICTNAENQRHAHRTGLATVPDNNGSANGMAKLNESIVEAMRIERASGMKIKNIAAKHNFKYQAVAAACRGTTWKTAPGPITK